MENGSQRSETIERIFMVFTSLLSRGRFDGLRRSVEARSEQPTLD